MVLLRHAYALAVLVMIRIAGLLDTNVDYGRRNVKISTATQANFFFLHSLSNFLT